MSGHPAKSIAWASGCLLLMLFVSLSCGFRKPWRSYEQQPFDSQKLRDGDAITRGTMVTDIFRTRMLTGKTRENVVGLLGEPDKKRPGSTSGVEVWLYTVEVTGETPRRYFPVSFDKNGAAFAGATKDGTMSIMVDE